MSYERDSDIALGKKLSVCGDSKSDKSVLLCGDRVTYRECFGDKELVFVGMAEQLEWNNDCVVTYNGDCCPVRYSGLEKLDT